MRPCGGSLYVYLEDIDDQDHPDDDGSDFRGDGIRKDGRCRSSSPLCSPFSSRGDGTTLGQSTTSAFLIHRAPASMWSTLGASGTSRSTCLSRSACPGRRNARRRRSRLQVELIRRNIDPTLFGWSYWHDSSHDTRGQAPLPQIHTHAHNPDHPHIPICSFAGLFTLMSNASFSPQTPILGALPSPRYLQSSEKVRAAYFTCELSLILAWNTQESRRKFRASRDIVLEVTLYGVKCRLLVAEVDGVLVAILLWYNGTEHLSLLHPVPDSHSPTTGRRDSAHSFRRFQPDVTPTRRRHRFGFLGHLSWP